MSRTATVKGGLSIAFTAIVVTLCPSAAQSAATASSTKPQEFTIYAVATRAQYVDYSDGITRANYQNPFNIDSKKFIPTTKGNSSSLPGNSAFFAFKLYDDASLKKSVGTASYTCSFNFNSHATCDAYYLLNGSTLFASGPVDFATIHSTLAITGGTSRYVGLNGQVVSTGPGADPAAKNESRLDFELLGG